MNQTAGINPVIQETAEADAQARAYRIRTFKIFGGLQIGLGILCAILSLVGIVIDAIQMNKECDYYNTYYNGYDYTYYRDCNRYWDAHILFGFDITCLIFSGWCLLTGIFPFCMNNKRRSSWRCLKITFMVCCIIGAAVFMPAVFSLGVVGALFRGEYSGGLTILSSFIAVFAMIEMVLAIVAASYCCCCSSWNSSDQPRTIYITTNQPGMLLSMPQTQIPNQQIQIPVVIPQSNVQGGVQPMGATAQRYQVPATHYSGASGSSVAQQCQTTEAHHSGTPVQQQTSADNPPPPYKE